MHLATCFLVKALGLEIAFVLICYSTTNALVLVGASRFLVRKGSHIKRVKEGHNYFLMVAFPSLVGLSNGAS